MGTQSIFNHINPFMGGKNPFAGGTHSIAGTHITGTHSSIGKFLFGFSKNEPGSQSEHNVSTINPISGTHSFDFSKIIERFKNK